MPSVWAPAPPTWPIVTENSIGVEHRALPTMAVVLGAFDDEVWQAMGTFSWAMMVHGSQEVVLHRPVPTEGSIVTTHRLAAMWDKGKAGVVEVESNAVDAESGRAMFTLRTSLFIRGEGGWGGDRGPSAVNPIPDRAPDHEVHDRVQPNQATHLPVVAATAIRCTRTRPSPGRRASSSRSFMACVRTGSRAGRSSRGVCDNDPDRFGGMAGRFASPALPGDELVVRIWELDHGAAFQTVRADGTVVFDAGRFTFSRV